MEWTFGMEQLRQTASDFLEFTGNKKLIAFHGEMGAGKTTFIHALCEVLGVTSTVASPTFSIINEYVYPAGSIYHIDLYRLKDEDEAIRAGVEDCLYSGALCLVEWPDRAPGIFPSDTLHVHIGLLDDQRRQIRA